MPEDIFEEGDDYVTLPPEFFDNLWQPDPYILNSKISGESVSVKIDEEKLLRRQFRSGLWRWSEICSQDSDDEYQYFKSYHLLRFDVPLHIRYILFT